MVKKFEEVVNLAIKRGFFYRSSEIYQGKAGFYDYGSLGTILKRKIENLWRKYFLNLFDNIWEIEPCLLMDKNVFVASRHLELFYDPITECSKCKKRYRADKLIEEKLGIKAESLTIEEMNEIFKSRKIVCPECKSKLSEVKLFNLMFPVFVGVEYGNFLLKLKKIKDLFEKGNQKYVEEIKSLLEEYEKSLKNEVFLRPETAQGPYVNFPREIRINRNKLPLGLLVVGKAFRNEISPRQALLRLREFTQAELQIFFDKDYWKDEFEKVKNEKINVLLVEDRGKVEYKNMSLYEILKRKNLPEFYLYFAYKIWDFLVNVLEIPKERLRFFELDEKEKAFYNKYHFDIEVFLEDMGWVEIAGLHYRVIEIKREDIKKIEDKKVKEILNEILSDKESIEVGYDLYNHLVHSKDLGYVVYVKDKPLIPLELEISFGIDRLFFSILYLFYTYDEKNDRYVLKLPCKIAPIQVAIFPLLKKKELVEKALQIYEKLRGKLKTFYDDTGSIGKRYRRQDEIGTPFCITVDYQTLEDNTVTVRFRDSMEQIRISIDQLDNYLSKFFNIS